ncbi:MAG: NAD(P)H-quinone oxidoreductase [Lentisphaeria bacterium]|nr:NAD(P)H-quinone oxidoreductase [Candidatus Neomarinimicrobiota bacterium]MCF7843024.1 NAD(P)H-quinone oxidoreductase [Lentisphaeria bacterium]
MRAIIVDNPGGPEQLRIGEVQRPEPKPHELLVKVKAASVNRADILQRQGNYPPPPSTSEILGLDAAGVVVDKGDQVLAWENDERVMALVPGGGYAEYVTIPEQMALPIPDNLSFTDAASIPEAFLTAYQAIVWYGQLKKRETALIHAGASGVGTAAIQLARTIGAKIIVTAGSDEKVNFCEMLGADLGVNYKEDDFATAVRNFTQGKGADVIVDFIGADYWDRNMASLAVDGRIVILATLGGALIEQFNIRDLFKKRGQLTTSSLRSRPLDYKVRLTRDFGGFALPRFNSGELKPVIDSVYSWQMAVEAHNHMEANANKGKIVLTID